MRDASSGSCILKNAAPSELNLTELDLQGAILRGVTCIDAELASIKLGRGVLDSSDLGRALLSRAHGWAARRCLQPTCAALI